MRRRFGAHIGTKIRIDRLLVERGLAPSRERAQALIMAGTVFLGDSPAVKPGQMVDVGADLRVRGAPHPYVGRGGVKLAHALEAFGIDVTGLVCIDVGASTGGFTDCLLQHGAAQVYAVDVGYGQLAWKLKQDPRVVVIERQNIRTIGAQDMPRDAGIAVIDVSFISLEMVIPCIIPFLKSGGVIIALVKPQFEVGRERVGKGGIVRDSGARQAAVEKVVRAAEQIGLVHGGTVESPIAGAKGNKEFFALFRKS